MEEIVKQGAFYLAVVIEICAGLIIGFASLKAAARTFYLFLMPRSASISNETIRLKLGRWLSLALEFELAADILRTAISPTWSDIGLLAAIIVLRTFLNFFLQLEIDKAEKRNPPTPGADTTGTDKNTLNA